MNITNLSNNTYGGGEKAVLCVRDALSLSLAGLETSAENL